MGLVVDSHPEVNILETAVLMEIEKLRRVSLVALREKYREVFAEETRCQHREHLFRRIAWRLQALAEGDLTERARERATQLARDADLRVVQTGAQAAQPPCRLPLALGGHAAQPEVERADHSGRGSLVWVPV